MRWWPWRRSQPVAEPSEDARHAVEHSRRQLADTERLDRAVDDLARRADDVSDQWQETRARNGIAEAAIDSIMRRVRHP